MFESLLPVVQEVMQKDKRMQANMNFMFSRNVIEVE